jgi:nitrous oxidase accessory protein NosD
VALDGHTIDGVGLGTGVLDDGHRGVTVTGGTLREFDVGIRLSGAHSGNLIHSNTFVRNGSSRCAA